MDARTAGLVALGSALGGVARYAVSVAFARSAFPAATLSVNLVGSFLVGFVVAGGLAGGWLSSQHRAFLVVGILGGFTTMSAFALESVELGLGESGGGAWAYVAATLTGCLLAAWAGRAAGLAVWGG